MLWVEMKENLTAWHDYIKSSCLNTLLECNAKLFLWISLKKAGIRGQLYEKSVKCNCQPTSFFFYPKTIVSPLIIALRYRFESEKSPMLIYGIASVLSLFDIYYFSLDRRFSNFHITIFFLYYIFCLVNREGSSGSHVPYTRSSLTIVRSQLLATVHATAV